MSKASAGSWVSVASLSHSVGTVEVTTDGDRFSVKSAREGQKGKDYFTAAPVARTTDELRALAKELLRVADSVDSAKEKARADKQARKLKKAQDTAALKAQAKEIAEESKAKKARAKAQKVVTPAPAATSPAIDPTLLATIAAVVAAMQKQTA